jgi:hypothetical protein
MTKDCMNLADLNEIIHKIREELITKLDKIVDGVMDVLEEKDKEIGGIDCATFQN